MNIWNKILSEPVRLFFPLGTLMALIGVLYWPLVILGYAANHTPWFHKYMVIFGFLFAFVIGFLCTAVPRFTGSSLMKSSEVTLLLLFWLLGILSIFLEHQQATAITLLLTVLTLVAILAKRFMTRAKNPPPTFIFIPFGFLCLVVSQILALIPQPTIELVRLGNNLFFQGTILFLLLGVGGFLIKSILGFGVILPQNPGDKMPEVQFFTKSLFLLVIAAILLKLSFFIEVLLNEKAGEFLRALVVSFICLFQIGIHKKPVSGKLTAYTLHLALWLLIIGLWGAALGPIQYRVAFLHLGFVGGFSLSTFGVATRVIFSHCGHSPLLNQKYTPFTTAITLMVIGLVARFAADFLPAGYSQHLAYGGIIWSLGAIVWATFVLSKLIRDTVTNKSPVY